MRIDNKPHITQQNDKTNEARKAEIKKANEASVLNTKNSRTDSVSLSERGREVADIALQLKEAKDVRSDRVSELKGLIESGNYDISGLDIAEAIVNKARNNLY